MADTVFVGIDRGKVLRQAVTRRNMASLAGLSYPEFCKTFDWLNLYGEDSAPRLSSKAEQEQEDRRRAGDLVPLLARYERVVLLGDRVAKAFGCATVPLYEWRATTTSPPLRVARMPHTSRQNWNTRGRGEGSYWQPAQEFLRELDELVARAETA